MKKLTQEVYNTIYRLRKKGNELSVNTRQRMIFYDIHKPELLDVTQAKRLMGEFGFVAQSELRY